MNSYFRKISFLAIGFYLYLGTGFVSASDFSPKKIYISQSPSVVFVFATERGGTGMAGTGSIIREDGLVITNAHVIYNRDKDKLYKKVFVYLKPDKLVGDIKKDLSRRYNVKVLYYDNNLDLALLKVKDIGENLKKIEFANPDEISIGEDVVAIGHPEQGGLWTLTTGTVSAVRANFEGVEGKDVFQTEASVNKGNSGGPLLDKRGYMIGVNSNIARKGSSGSFITDINFSIKSSVAKRWLKQKGYNIKYGTLPLETVEVVAAEKKVEPAKKLRKKVSKKEKEIKTVIKVEEDEPEKLIPVLKKKTGARILTKRRPYDMNKLIKDRSNKIEAEMETMMDEIRGKRNSGRSKSIFDEF